MLWWNIFLEEASKKICTENCTFIAPNYSHNFQKLAPSQNVFYFTCYFYASYVKNSFVKIPLI